VFATLYTAPYTGLLVLVLHAGRSIPVIGSPVGVGVFTVLAWSYMFRFVARGRHAHVRRVILLDDLNDADALISECRRELRDPSLSADERAAVELNLAGALVSASLGDRANGLPEAYRIVERSMSCGAPERTFLSAVLLAQAMSAGATRSGDDEGYEDALQLVLDAAGNASSVRPEAPSEARAVRAAGLMTRSRLAESEGDGERAERLYRDAGADLERALATSPEDSGVHAQHTVALGRSAVGERPAVISTTPSGPAGGRCAGSGSSVIRGSAGRGTWRSRTYLRAEPSSSPTAASAAS
jgi:hypothetical protein